MKFDFTVNHVSGGLIPNNDIVIYQYEENIQDKVAPCTFCSITCVVNKNRNITMLCFMGKKHCEDIKHQLLWREWYVIYLLYRTSKKILSRHKIQILNMIEYFGHL